MCTCASCSYTDDFKDKGFAAWPRGNPAGRKSAAAYAAHVRHCLDSSEKEREFSEAELHIVPEPRFPRWITAQTRSDPGLDRSYPTHPDRSDGWSSTAAYVKAFIAVNHYVTPEKIAKREAYQAEVRRGEQAARKREKEMDRMRKPAPKRPSLVQLARELRKAA